MESIDSSAIVVVNEKGEERFKDKLRNWYIKHVASNEQTFRKVHDVRTAARNTAGSVALGICCPELLPFVPAIQKGYKAVRDAVYEGGKKVIHKIFNVKEEEIQKNEVPEVLKNISEDEVQKLVETAGDIVVEKTGGKSR